MGRGLALVLVIGGCNQIYGLDDTKLRYDAPAVDGPGCSDGALGAPIAETVANDLAISQPQARHDLRELWVQVNGASAGVYVARRNTVGEPWSAPVPAPFTAFEDQAPALSGDGLRIVFTSNRPGGRVWEAVRASIDDEFPAMPTPLTGLADHAPGEIDLSYDGKTLYFVEGEDYLETSRPSFGAPFGPARTIASGVRYPSISPDGLELFYNPPTGSALYRQTRGSTLDVFGTPTLLRDLGEDPDVTSNGTSIYVHVDNRPVRYERPCP